MTISVFLFQLILPNIKPLVWASNKSILVDGCPLFLSMGCAARVKLLANSIIVVSRLWWCSLYYCKALVQIRTSEPNIKEVLSSYFRLWKQRKKLCFVSFLSTHTLIKVSFFAPFNLVRWQFLIPMDQKLFDSFCLDIRCENKANSQIISPQIV